METPAIAAPAHIVASAARRRAILCVLGASACFAVAAAFVKAVAGAFPTFEIVAFRSGLATLATLPLLWRIGGLRALRTRRPWSHVWRMIWGFTGMATSFYGYATLPLATNTALGFAMPLVLTVLSVPLLGERVGWRRYTAVLVGLVGVLVVVRPWGGAADALPLVPAAVVLFGVVAWALAMISIRKMGEAGESNVVIVLWFSIGSTVMAAVLTVPVWVTPDPLQLAALCAVGVISALAQMLMTEGYRAGETTLVAPFEYGAIIYTTTLGLVIWGEVPDGWSLLGIAIIIGSGLYIWRREAVLGVRRS
ncbi:DMT family transporter [Limobrevibacterium gyesilva]|uniref:DMT family transporter n=1 Tax=Limobrevibacterium gyesilva TaxID=2991712 RepID=A0AA41YME6_9PROT|nr:DMT family transporter [Limobrevibacterium gyesilva]MCW3475181.1 DMT family transporter [Limobrevibacterium gyesilva]